MRPPYLSISGIVTDDDVETARQCALIAPRRTASGVLVSAKTLRGEPTTSRRYHAYERVPELLAALADAGCLPVIHYNSRAVEGLLAAELARLARENPSMRGLQLNVLAPEPRAVRTLAVEAPLAEVVIQIKREVFGASPVPADAAHYARMYGGLVEHALLDLSAGEGAPLDVSFAARVVRAWRVLRMPQRLGIAGGLGPDTGEVLRTLRRELGPSEAFAALSFCAESALRSPVADPTEGEKHQDALDRRKALAWVRVAAEALGGVT